MTDSEYMEMSRLLDFLTDGADTLRVVFKTHKVDDPDMAIRTGGEITTREVATDQAKAHPDFSRKMFLLPDQEIKALVRIINECTDWTSDKFKASVVYQKMRSFISATSGMPKRISGMYKDVRSKCLELMDLIPGVFRDLYPPQIRELLADQYYQQAVDDGLISPPFTWNLTIIDLAFWIDSNVFQKKPAYGQVIGGKRNWMLFDCLFRIDGEPVTAKQLRTAIKG